MEKATNDGRMFYVRMGLLYILLLAAGFVPFMVMRFSSGGTMGPALVLHAVSYLGWFLLFPYQASLVRARNIKRHMALGKLSLVLVTLMTLSAVLVTISMFARGSSGGTPFTPEHFIMLPMMDALIFPVLYALGFLNRKTPETHKHFMLLAGLAILDPALARMGMLLGFAPISIPIHFALLALVWVRDRRILGAAHWVTKLVAAILVARYVVFFTLGPTEAWAGFTHWLFG